ncbi:MAG: hypothetical protein HQK72_09270 [Desulfamplus sp.]|nr:hypothetical protein [Desulfamplus sp.]
MDNHQLTSTINKEKKLAAIRSKILALPAEKALDTILDTPFPASLIQSFPEQDLHFLMHHIGEDDFLPVLALASSEQWEYILDVEVWNNDRLDLVQMTNMLSLLYKADPQRLIRWAIKDKTEFIEYYLFNNLEIRIREHDEDPSDFMDILGDIKNEFITIDSIFYFRFPHQKWKKESYSNSTQESEDDIESNQNLVSSILDQESIESESYQESMPQSSEIFISDMLNTLADMDLSVFHALLLETCTIIPSETEEEEFRLKNVRLAEKGFLPPHEAVAIYQPLKTENLKKRPSIFLTKPFIESDLPHPPLYISSLSNSRKDNIFASSLENLSKNDEIALNLQSELAFLVNSVASADKQVVRSREELEKVVRKTSSYLSLGIEIIYYENALSGLNSSSTANLAKNLKVDLLYDLTSNLTPEIGSRILIQYPLKDIFRVASGSVISLKEKARQWYGNSYIVKKKLPLTFLGEKWLGVIGGLLIERPLFFGICVDENSEDKNISGVNSNKTKVDRNYIEGTFYRDFSSLKDIDNTSKELENIIEIDGILKHLNPNFSLISNTLLTWKSLFLTLWAMKRLGIDNKTSVEYGIPLNKFKPFFIQLLNLREKSQSAISNSNQPTILNLNQSAISNSKQSEIQCEKHEVFGKIDKVVRNDFFSWLAELGCVAKNWIEINSRIVAGACEAKVVSGNDNFTTAHKIFNELFDEIEDEYGRVSQKDIDPKLIYHFIIQE